MASKDTVQAELQAEEEELQEEKEREKGGGNEYLNKSQASTSQEDRKGSVTSEIKLSPRADPPSGSFHTSTPDNYNSVRNGERAHDYSGLSPLRNGSLLSNYHKEEEVIDPMEESVDLDEFEKLLHEIEVDLQHREGKILQNVNNLMLKFTRHYDESCARIKDRFQAQQNEIRKLKEKNKRLKSQQSSKPPTSERWNYLLLILFILLIILILLLFIYIFLPLVIARTSDHCIAL